MNKFFIVFIIIQFHFITGYSQLNGIYDVRDFGAVGDSITLDTRGIQAAIDKCSADGGGKVFLAQGKFRTGTIYLKSFVTLHIEAGAVLLGSTDIADYATDTYKIMYKNESGMDRCLIFARDATSIGIEGSGEINGQGSQKNFSARRPMILRLLRCTNIRLKDIFLKDPASWTTSWLYCSDIVVENLRISSRANFNGDGLDFDGCSNVRVSGCSFDTSDDAICLQTSRPDTPCRNVVISNCIFHSKWAGIRIGLLSMGDIESVAVSNCIFSDIEDSGLKIQMNEGASMKNMVFTGLIMKNVQRPVFMTHCQVRACVDAPGEPAPMKTMKGFIFEDILIEADTCGKNSAIIISGMTGNPIEDLTFRNIRMTTRGGGTGEDAGRRVLNEFSPEVLKGGWPEVYLIGTVPASGFYARHVKGLIIDNSGFSTFEPDLRPSVVLDDVSDGRLSELQSGRNGSPESDFRFQNVQETIVSNCSTTETGNIFFTD